MLAETVNLFPVQNHAAAMFSFFDDVRSNLLIFQSKFIHHDLEIGEMMETTKSQIILSNQVDRSTRLLPVVVVFQ